jgi:CRP/FNR family transcriptional regulator
MAYTALFNHIRKFIALDPAEEALLAERLQYRKMDRKGHLLKQGEICKSYFFVLKGCFRMYLNTDKGTEQIVHFGIENWWIADHTSLLRGATSDFNIQAIEDSEIACIDQQELEKVFDEIPKLERYFRIVTQHAYAAAHMRIKYIYCFSGEERYFHFHDSFPEFIQRVPQYMIASYLGFTPEFLSKIRAKKR